MTMKVRALSIAILLLATMWLAGCGHYVCGITFGGSSCTPSGGGLGGNGNGTAVAFAFFENQGQIQAASLNTAGNFAVLNNFVSPPATLSAIGGMTIAKKQWLYVAVGTQIQGYSIDGATGALTALTGSPFTTPATEVYSITTDPTGKFLFQSRANDDQVTVFAINQTTGGLSLVASYPTGDFAGEATTDGLGKYLYVTAANLGTQVAVFSIDPTIGNLTAVSGSPFPISIAELRSEPTGKYLLGVTGNGANNGVGTDNHVYVFSIGSTGAIAQVTGSPFSTTFIPAHLAVHPGGTLVYTFNQTVSGTSPMEGFLLDTSTGALSTLAVSPFTSLTAGAGMFDQSGAYLFMHPGTSLSVATVDTTTGALTANSTTLTNVGNTEGWAVTDPH